MKTPEQWQSDIIAQKPAESAELNSTSRVAIWRLIVYMVAWCASLLESLLEAVQTEITEKMNTTQFATIPWYIAKVKEFQDYQNEVIELIDGVWRYRVSRPEYRPVKYCAIRESGNTLTFLVAGADSAGLPAPLDAVVREKLRGYLNQIKYPGTNILIFSAQPDEIEIELTVSYNPLYSQSYITTQTAAAVETYTASLAFNGSCRISGMTEAIMDIAGITDVICTSAIGREFVDDGQTVEVDFTTTRRYEMVSGYGKVIALTITANSD